MKLTFGGTDIGLMRPSNQDHFECGVISDSMAFGVLCDGMGGANGGEVAAQIAVEFATKMLRRELREEMSELSLRSVLSSAIAGANALIYDKAQKDENLTGMGTTILVAVHLNGTLYAASVGDSRAYLFTPDKHSQLTKDHTVVQMLVDIGEISEEDAQRHPKRHYVTRIVGVFDTVEPDFFVERLRDGDIALLCTDGLYPYLDPGVTYEFLCDCIAAKSAQPLIDLALANGTTDNITAVVMATAPAMRP